MTSLTANHFQQFLDNHTVDAPQRLETAADMWATDWLLASDSLAQPVGHDMLDVVQLFDNLWLD